MYKSGYLKVSITLIIILFISCITAGCQKYKSKEAFNFVFMSDIHVQYELDADQGFELAIDRINEIGPEFVVSGGDLIMDALGGTYQKSIEQIKLYNEISSKLKAPLYNTIGNHDIFGVYKESGIKPDHPEYGKQMYRNYIGNGNTYYSFYYKNWLFMSLDAIGITGENHYIGYIDSSQVEWIKNELKNIKKNTPIVLITHIPFVTFANQIQEDYPVEFSPSLVVTNASDILKLFDEYNLKLVLQGHLHLVEEMVFNGIHFITGGSISGNKWTGKSHGFEEGFLVIEIINNEPNWRFVDYNWDPIHSQIK